MIYLPIESNALAASSASPNLEFPFTYKDAKTAPNPERQEASHPHQVVEHNGTLYVPDLGSDRIWLVKREGESGLRIDGYLQAPEGSGPRHVVVSKDCKSPSASQRHAWDSLSAKHLYMVAELGHKVIAFDLASGSQTPIPGFDQSIIPPSAPSSHSKYMDSSEIAINPVFPNTLYAANRLEMQIFKMQPDLPPLPDYPPSGDAVAILILSEDGSKVEDVKHVRTGCDNLRGLTVSPDGKYVAVAGQDGGGVEVYVIGGIHGEDWELAAKDESLKGVNTLVWA